MIEGSQRTFSAENIRLTGRIIRQLGLRVAREVSCVGETSLVFRLSLFSFGKETVHLYLFAFTDEYITLMSDIILLYNLSYIVFPSKSEPSFQSNVIQRVFCWLFASSAEFWSNFDARKAERSQLILDVFDYTDVFVCTCPCFKGRGTGGPSGAHTTGGGAGARTAQRQRAEQRHLAAACGCSAARSGSSREPPWRFVPPIGSLLGVSAELWPQPHAAATG